MNAIPISSVVGLIMALGGTSLLAFFKRGSKVAPINPSRHLFVTWGSCFALLYLIIFWEQRPLSSIRMEAGNFRAWGIGALLGISIVALSGLSLAFARNKAMKGSVNGILRLAETPTWFRIAAVFTAGITEEIVYRGYPIERLLELTGQLWLAALIPLVIFTVVHLSGWSMGHLVGVFFGGLLLTALYLWQRDLIACMIAHTIIDSPIIVFPWLTRRFVGDKTTSKDFSTQGNYQ